MGSTLKSFLFYEVRVSPSTQKFEKIKHDRECSRRNVRDVVCAAHKDWLAFTFIWLEVGSKKFATG